MALTPSVLLLKMALLGFKLDLGSAASDLQKDLGRFTEQVMADVLTTSQKYTPRRSGQAARNWKKSGTGTATTVTNRLPYINRLDSGSSRQAPNGIIKPTLDEVSKRNR